MAFPYFNKKTRYLLIYIYDGAQHTNEDPVSRPDQSIDGGSGDVQ
jgi:hypothetical protein